MKDRNAKLTKLPRRRKELHGKPLGKLVKAKIDALHRMSPMNRQGRQAR